jgi:hypothetical protein
MCEVLGERRVGGVVCRGGDGAALYRLGLEGRRPARQGMVGRGAV